MKIENSTLADIDSIFKLYEVATNFQKQKFAEVVWPEFEKSLVKTEIEENRQWKLIHKDQIACVWASTFSDPQIWEEKNEEPAVYIHRIASNPEFRGLKCVAHIIEWAKQYAIDHKKQYVRLDTCGENNGLIKYYTNCGFDFLGIRKLKSSDGLPAHYVNADVCFFQIELSK